MVYSRGIRPKARLMCSKEFIFIEIFVHIFKYDSP